MNGYQADTFKCALLINNQQLVGFFEVSEERITSFFISCTKRLWDCVGHFLGRRVYSQRTAPAGLFGSPERGRHSSRCQINQMLP
jgi:hypothetical protein